MNLFLIVLSSRVIAFNTQISAETSPSDLLLRPLNFVAVPFSNYFLTKRYHRARISVMILWDKAGMTIAFFSD